MTTINLKKYLSRRRGEKEGGSPACPVDVLQKIRLSGGGAWLENEDDLNRQENSKWKIMSKH